MTAEELKTMTDIVREPFSNDKIFRAVKRRALDGYYWYIGYDFEEVEIARLKDAGFKVTVGQNKEVPWFVVEW